MSDLIDRQAAIEALEKFEKQCWEDMCFRPLMSDARVIIKGLPSVDPKHRTGRWVPNKHTDTVLCSQCEKCYGDEYNYCPNCGAYMKGENDDKTTSD